MSAYTEHAPTIAEPEVERAVLGSILLDPGIFPFVADRVEAADFYDYKNQLFFEAYSEVYKETAKTGGLPEIETIIQWLKDRSKLEEAGDFSYIASLEMNVISTGSAPEQAEIVAEMARRREIVNVSQWAASAATGRLEDMVTDSGDIAVKIEQCIQSIKPYWEPPQPLGFGQLPTFPVDETLPSWVASMCHQVADHLQVPIDLPAMIVLGCVAGAVQRKIAIKPKRDWNEPLCLWCIPCLATGNRKTAALSLMDSPLRKYSNDRSAEWQKGQRLVKEKKAALQSKLKKLMKGVADGDEASEREAEAVNEQLEALERDNQQERLLAEDVTPEALESLLASNNERITIKSDEGGFFKGLGRYSDVTNVDLLNKAYSGSSHYRDRVGAGFSHLKSPCLTLILAPQPKILKDKVLADERDSGLPARCLFVLPRSLIGQRDSDPPDISQNVRSHYFESMTALCKLPWNDIDGSKDDPHLITVSQEAGDIYRKFVEELEPKISETGIYSEFSDWARKSFGTLYRIAGILHLMDNAENPAPWRVELRADTMAKAVKILRYLIPHAEAAFSIIDGASKVSGAEVILHWILRQRLRTFTARECQRSGSSKFREKEGQSSMWNSLGYLQEMDYIREAQGSVIRDKSGKGQKPSPTFRVNPFLFSVPEENISQLGGVSNG